MVQPSVVIDVLPAERGDCLWIECTREEGPPWRMVIDGGMPDCWPALEARIASCAGAAPGAEHDPVRIDLAVVSHIDADHIGGMLRLFRAATRNVTFGDIWFNGLPQLPETLVGDPRSVPQGEELVSLLSGDHANADATRRSLPWNERFRRAAVMTTGDGAFETIAFPDGPTLTLLSPTPRRLVALRNTWEKYFSKLKRGVPEAEPAAIELPLQDLAALAAMPTGKDPSVANGSSIAFLLEHAGRSCLFGADAFSSVLGSALTQLAAQRGTTIALDVFKLPHHASKHNVTAPLLEAAPAEHYIISTNGERFNHPDDIALARVVTGAKKPCTLWFNYASKAAERWSDAGLQQRYGYQTRIPTAGTTAGVRIELPGRSL